MGETDRKPGNDASGAGRGKLVALSLVSLVGLGASIYLSGLHWQVHNFPGHVSFCALSQGVNCDTVALSRYSVVAGVPVSSWGILFYLAAVVLSVWGLLRREPPFPWGLLGLMNAVALGISVYLFLVGMLLIHSLCIMCMLLYLVNLANAVVCVLGLRGAGGLSRFFSLLARDLVTFFSRPLIGGGLVVMALGLVVALLVVTPRLYPEKPTSMAGGIEEIPTGRTPEGHNWIGAERPEVTITEYSDYECPFCRRAHDVVRQLVRGRKDWLRLVHVHVPLDHKCNRSLKRPFHKNACDCARAAICADRQDRFWKMNDALFLRRCGLDAGGLAVLARNLGLDTAAFRSCMQDPRTEKALQRDLSECRGVAEECRSQGRGFGTPTFTVNGQVVVGYKKPGFWIDLVEKIRRQGSSGGPGLSR